MTGYHERYEDLSEGIETTDTEKEEQEMAEWTERMRQLIDDCEVYWYLMS